MLTLAQAKTYLKLAPPATQLTEEDEEVQALLAAAVGVFRVQSKRRFPAENEPRYLVPVIVAGDTEPTLVPGDYIDPAVLSEAEQQTALQWLRFTLGHFYENRQTVSVGVNVTEVPHTAKLLMNLLREPTL